MTLDPFGKRKRSGANRTIALIGWAQRVKDPIWALEVLARLRVHDPDWKLLLLGSDFKTRSHLSELRYRDRFRARAQHDDVRDGITYAGYCRDLPEALRAAGFILSASRREAFPVGSTEGAASAAAPVIRNWPMYTAYDAPHRIYPSDWTVESPDDATNRILTYAEPQIQAEAGATQHAGSSSSTSTGPPSPRATSASSLALSSSLLPRCHYGRIHSPLGLALHRHRVLGMVLDGVCVICRAVWAASCGWPDLAFIGESLPGPCGHVALVGQAFTGVCLGVASVGQALKSVWRSGPAVQLERLKPIYPAGTLGTLGTPPRGELLAQEVCLVAQAPGGIAKCAGLPAQFDRVATNALGGGLQRVDSRITGTGCHGPTVDLAAVRFRSAASPGLMLGGGIRWGLSCGPGTPPPTTAGWGPDCNGDLQAATRRGYGDTGRGRQEGAVFGDWSSFSSRRSISALRIGSANLSLRLAVCVCAPAGRGCKPAPSSAPAPLPRQRGVGSRDVQGSASGPGTIPQEAVFRLTLLHGQPRRAAIEAIPEQAWRAALDGDGEPRDGAQVSCRVFAVHRVGISR